MKNVKEKAERYNGIFTERVVSKNDEIKQRIIKLIEMSHDVGGFALHKWEADEMLDWLEKQGEKNDKVSVTEELYEHIRNACACIEDAMICNNTKDMKDYLSQANYDTKCALDMIEKQDEKKSINKVEPKFKVGDWIVYNRNDSSREILYVYDIRDGRYYFNDNIHISWSIKECEEKCHLWSIEDAKDGDVLALKDGNNILIFRNLDNNTSFSSYYNIKGKGELGWSNRSFIPATKEQYDLLFTKMKEAGYEWDSEKKELKKIKQKSPDNAEHNSEIIKDTWYICTCQTCSEDGRIWFKKGAAYLGSDILKYDLGFEPNEYQDYFRLWTIQDAKDGDVLYHKSQGGFEYFVMNRCINELGNIDSYCRYNDICGFGVDIPDAISISNNITPATEEQHNFLFQKMREAGYEWNDKKKELKKINSCSNCNNIKGCVTCVNGDQWEHTKDYEQNHTWSEEDEHRLQDTIYFLDTAKKHYASTVELDACIEWLKSLKNRRI